MSIVRVTLNALYFGQVCQNVMHFKNPDGALTDAQVCAEIRDHWMPDFKAVSAANVVWNNISCQTVDPSGTAPANLAVSIAGAQSGSSADETFVCYLLRIRTGLSGRHNRGRIYVPGPNPNNTNLGLWTSAVVTAWATPLANMIANYKATGSRPLILGVAPRSSPSDFVAMTNMELAPLPALQRRRNIGIGI